MTSNVIAVLLLLAFVAISNAASVKDWCPLPSKLKSYYDFDWKTRPNEWSNTNAKTAYLQLVLSWTPTFCDSLSQSARDKEFQCRNSNSFGLIVHGLWPQASRVASVRDHPRNCRNEKQLNATFVKRFYCIMPSEDLVQSQWEKHGACHYTTATSYYTTVENLYKLITIPDIRSMKNPTAATIKNSFLAINSKLFSSAIQVSMNSDNRLKEVKICYNLNNQVASCNN